MSRHQSTKQSTSRATPHNPIKAIILLATMAIACCAMAQSPVPSDKELQRSFREKVHNRNMSQHYPEFCRDAACSVSTPHAASPCKSLPDDRVWFPGEWEEVKAVCLTPYYNYLVPGERNSRYWKAMPLLSGYARYYHYGANGWQERGGGPYNPVMDTASDFGKVFFYLMDGIQMGGAEAWVRVEKASDSSLVKLTLRRMGLRHDKVRFIVGQGNSYWYRDCGPIAFYYGGDDSLAMLDFEYYTNRALDDSLPSLIHWQMGIPNYHTPIRWEGGNCLVDGAGMVFTSDAIYSHNADIYGPLVWDGVNPESISYSQRNPLTPSEVRQGLQALIGQRATHILPSYWHDGGTGHVDLYADAWDENGFVFTVLGDEYSSWSDYRIGAANRDSLCSYSSLFNRNYYTKAALPLPKMDDGEIFINEYFYSQFSARSYSNHTIVNNVILQPCFSPVEDGEPTAEWDRQNMAAISAAYPGYTIYPVDMREFDGTGGAIHCVTKQIPADNPIRILHKNLHDTLAIGHLSAIPVSAIITNHSGINHAQLIWREVGSTLWDTIHLAANGNRFYGFMPRSVSAVPQHSVEYFISATSNNGKTITKPMTANQGGYYSFTYTDGGTTDSSLFDFDTLPLPMEDITFRISSPWAVAEGDQPLPPAGIEDAATEQLFGQFSPNPARQEAHLSINLGDGASYSVSIIDPLGRTIHSTSLSAAGHIQYTIHANRLAAGVYLVVFSNKESRIVRRLIVK